MFLQEMIGKIMAGERDGLPLWKVLLSEIEYEPITDPAEGVLAASLAENILRFGLLQPILLRKNEPGGKGGAKYAVVAGRRRIEAMKMLGRTHIPALVISSDAQRAKAISLSENMLRQEPHYLEVALQLSELVKNGWTDDQLSGALAMPRDELRALLAIAALPDDHRRRLRKMEISQQDAVRLQTFSLSLQSAILDKCIARPEINLSELITEMIESPDFRLTQTRKVLVNDVRVFLNTVEKSATTMKEAGFDTQVKRDDLDDCIVFEIRVAKRQGELLGRKCDTINVSRETYAETAEASRFSSVKNIFQALAEDECKLSENVSRETFSNGLTISSENAEKLELCIDERGKR